MNLIKKRILITAGEPSSISSEITIKAIKKLKNLSNVELIVITDPSLIKNELKNLNKSAELNILNKSLNLKDYKNDFINIMPIKLHKKAIPGILNKKIQILLLTLLKLLLIYYFEKKLMLSLQTQ